MEYKDYYKILGVPKTATEKEIKNAFRRLARQCHPDVNKNDPNAETRFKEVNEAYEVLGDTEKRQKYDQLGSNWQAYEQWQRAGGGGQGAPFDFTTIFGFGNRPGGGPQTRSRTFSEDELSSMFGGGGGYSDFFRTFFGAGPGAADATGTRARRASPRVQAGQDIEQEVEISLREAFQGTKRVLTLRNPDGTSRRLEVTIRPGIPDGMRVRLAGQGQPGIGGAPAGSLYVKVKITPDPTFTRDGHDLTIKLPVPLTTAMLGGEARVPTMAGDRLLRVPPETPNGRRIRLGGQGMPHFNNPRERGDLYAEVVVQLPRNLTPRQRELFEELARLEQPDQASA